jgi:nitrite reductase/ring-hydroxylating ferredoxin subunit
MLSGAWWTVALSESVQEKKALAVVCGGQQLALFRNDAGTVFALEDRCPHRRVLLSPGVVKDGALQCPYHGWTFDGASGRCTDIPNLRRDEAIPAKYQAVAFPVTERGGFVHVWKGQGIPAHRVPADDYARAAGVERGVDIIGAAVAGIAHADYLDALLDGPQCLLGFAGVEISDAFLGDLRVDENHAVLDRGALWKGKGERSAFVRDHPLIMRTRVALNGASASVDLLDQSEQPLVTIFICTTANRRGTTSLYWRGFVHPGALARMPLRVRLRRMAGAPPFTVLSRLDGGAIAALEVAPSWDLVQALQRSAA